MSFKFNTTFNISHFIWMDSFYSQWDDSIACVRARVCLFCTFKIDDDVCRRLFFGSFERTQFSPSIFFLAHLNTVNIVKKTHMPHRLPLQMDKFTE